MGTKSFVIKGNIVYTEKIGEIVSCPSSYLVCEEGIVAGIYDSLPEKYTGLEIKDFGDRLVIPGLVDLHLHAPQYAFRGLGMDKELLEWLNTITFPEEARYAEEEYAKKAYAQFVEGLKNGATSRACVFATLHRPATLLLMDMLEKSGLNTMVGKVNMNRNSPDILREASTEVALAETKQWLEEANQRNYQSTQPILTPRFIPTCTDDLMEGLAALQQEYHLPVQSHLSENLSEIAWVKELCPNAAGYADAYRQFNMLGGQGVPTIMAHCIHLTPQEVELLQQSGTYVAHCPGSNANLSSGIAPMRQFLQSGVKAGLGTDVAGGFSASVFRAMSDAVQHSKLRWRLVDEKQAPLTVAEVFYLATKGGGEFFGKVGSFEKGYQFDAVVLDDENILCPNPLTPVERLERAVYLAEDANVFAKFISGQKVKG